MNFIEFQLLFLIVVVNGAPVLTAALLGRLWAWPVDGGGTAPDGRPWLGRSKTWRGLAVALATAVALAWLLGLPPMAVGLTVGTATMAGDLLSSFIKRRLGLDSSSHALFLDQVPEALLPLLVLPHGYALDWPSIAEVVAAFVVLELLLSQILFRMRVRKRPY